MKLLSRLALINLLCCLAFPAAADDAVNMANQQENSDNLQKLVQYLQSLGGYLGYDVTQSPTANNNTISQTLINMPFVQAMQTYLFNTFLGSIPVNTAANSAFALFLPNDAPGASTLNAFANATFSAQNYSSPSTQQVGVSPLIDQQTYQQDPVSQAVLNILGTPDYSYCTSYDSGTWPKTGNCAYLYENLVSANVIGAIPDSKSYFSYNYNQQFLSQLNSNSLTAPLLYSTQNPSSNSTSSSSSNNGQNQGLVAQTQAQQAANFIRYVSGAVTPIKLPNWKVYDNLYTQANAGPDSNVTPEQQHEAQALLSNYFTNLRTYAAQSSVGLSNLYFIMSKRLPQNQNTSNNSSTPMSQAMNEFNMATWRLFNADMSNTNTQWINQINNASQATVEKEIATLLAEINYQLYLDRQIQERILLTNSIMLMQNTRAAQPSADFTSNPNPQQ